MRNLDHLKTKITSSASLEISPSSSNNAFPSHLITEHWPRLRAWNTIDARTENEAYDLLIQLAMHPTLEQASVNGLFSRWHPNGVNRAIRIGREILSVRQGKRAHVLTLTLLCNGERIFDENGIYQGGKSSNDQNGMGSEAVILGCSWELYKVHIQWLYGWFAG